MLAGLLEQHTGLAMPGKLAFIACSSLAQVPSMTGTKGLSFLALP